MKSNKGFTIVELIIVISIISVLASLAIPMLIRVRVQANESACAANLRTLSTASEAFRSSQNPPVYAADMNSLIGTNPPYLDSSWADNERQGFNFNYVSPQTGGTYACMATPTTQNISGINSYCVDQTGVIRRYAAGAVLGNGAGCDAGGASL